MIFKFFYLNIFAFFLVAFGVSVYFIPQDIFYLILKILIACFPVYSGLSILLQYKAKNRKLKILIARNLNGIRPDTFEHIRGTPCGWIVADIALQELRKTEYHKSFSKKNWKEIRNAILFKKKNK
jgi:hypothetical protein